VRTPVAVADPRAAMTPAARELAAGCVAEERELQLPGHAPWQALDRAANRAAREACRCLLDSESGVAWALALAEAAWLLDTRTQIALRMARARRRARIT